MKVGQRVKIKDNKMSRAWKMANKVGIITGSDPRGFDKDVVAVRLDSMTGICEAGIHIDNLKEIQDAPK